MTEELIQFLAEQGKLDPPALFDKIKNLKLIFMKQAQTPQDEAELEKLIVEACKLSGPVTLCSIQATSTQACNWKKTCYTLAPASVGRRYLTRITGYTMLFMIILVALESCNRADGLISSITPFLYGALGSLVFLFRNVSEFYVQRTFAPRKIPLDRLRVVMGAALAWIFVRLFFNSDNPETVVLPGLPASAMSFLIEYSVDFFYQLMDRLLNAVSWEKKKPEQNTAIQPTKPTTPNPAENKQEDKT